VALLVDLRWLQVRISIFLRQRFLKEILTVKGAADGADTLAEKRSRWSCFSQRRVQFREGVGVDLSAIGRGDFFDSPQARRQAVDCFERRRIDGFSPWASRSAGGSGEVH